MSTVPCDIYIRIGKEGQDEKYVKRIHSENEFDKHAIKKYEGSGLKCFYVHKDQRRLFMNSLVTQTLAKIDSYTENEDIVDAISDSYEIAKDLAVTTGIDSHSAILIDGTLESMTKVVDANPKFVQLFSTLVKYRGTVSYRHSYLIMIFAKKVLSKLTWAADDIVDDLYSSLVFLSFFHDIFLADDKLIKINSKEDLLSTELSKEESDLVHNHANLAATLVQKMPRAPSGIDILIRQHHGTPNGVGFTNAHTSSISKLSIIFIVLETFVWRLLNFKKGEESMSTLFVDLEKEFMLPSYREVVVALKASIIS